MSVIVVCVLMQIFWLIPPTKENYELYEESSLARNKDVFFADEVKSCQRIVIEPGTILFIPAGTGSCSCFDKYLIIGFFHVILFIYISGTSFLMMKCWRSVGCRWLKQFLWASFSLIYVDDICQPTTAIYCELSLMAASRSGTYTVSHRTDQQYYSLITLAIDIRFFKFFHL